MTADGAPILPDLDALLDTEAPLDDERVAAIAQMVNTFRTYTLRGEHLLREYARQMRAGYSVGDLSVYCTAPHYKQLANSQHVAEYDAAEIQGHDLVMHLKGLYEGKNPAHYQSWLRRRPDYESLQRYLDSQPDGWVEKYGDPKLDVRTSAPDAYCIVLDPRDPVLPDPEDTAPTEGSDAAEEYTESPGLSPGD